MKTATVKLTSAIGINGQLIRRGEVITIGEGAAKDLLRRGKAELATAEDEPEDEDAALPVASDEAAAEAKAKPTKAKK